MNRRILLQVAGPAVAIGLLLFATSLVSAWYISKLQNDLAQILSQNVTSLEAAQDLEIQVRRLRFHSLLALVDPGPTRQTAIDEDRAKFEDGLRRVREAANTEEKQALVVEIEAGYRRYNDELRGLPAEIHKAGPAADLGRLADAHPVNYVVLPCQKLLLLNKDSMQKTREESDLVSKQVQVAMLLLGILGPFGGMLIGYGVARGLSRSIYQLSVRVRDMAERLDQDVASVSIAADGDLRHLDHQLRHVVRRVEEIAERVQRQQQEMLRAEQLAAVGQLGASVAHEIRNPLTSIKLLVEAGLRSQHQLPLSREDLQVIHGEIERLERTAQGLLDFARLPAPQRAILDLHDAASQALDLIRARANQQHVAICTQIAEVPLPVRADRDQLHTVLVNLLLNALDAMPNGGGLEIELGTASTEANLSISDTGAGIAPAIAGRLFTPFASTKPTGTGLGLSLSRRIIEEHGGQISASNRPQGGARFTITLPLVPEETAEKGVKPPTQQVDNDLLKRTPTAV
jgi:signal transduction histidine kinase